MRITVLVLLSFACSCSTTTYYISRHAEKEGTMSNNPPLTPCGEQQAVSLKNYLQQKKIRAVFSTDFLRTKATAAPTAEFLHLPVTIYDAQHSASLIDSLMKVKTGNVLIIGHSNTVDDMVNEAIGLKQFGDLPDTEYGSLFIVTKKGKRFTARKITVPSTTTE